MNGKDPAYLKSKAEMYRAAWEQPIGQFFNYTERFNQPLTEIADVLGKEEVFTSTQEESILAFIAQDPDSTDGLVECACRYTGVPLEPRLDDNTADLA